MRSNMDLFIQDNNVMCKILPATFKGSVRAWYNNLEPGSITSFGDLCAKLVARFNSSIPAKMSCIELFGITQAKDKSSKAYLKRFNKEMLMVENLIELIASKALISEVREKTL